MLCLTCTMISSVNLACYRVSHAILYKRFGYLGNAVQGKIQVFLCCCTKIKLRLCHHLILWSNGDCGHRFSINRVSVGKFY